jgi:hypothetical protein
MTQFHSNITLVEPAVRKPSPVLLVFTQHSTYAVAFGSYLGDDNPRASALSGTFAGRIDDVEVAAIGYKLADDFVLRCTESIRVHAMKAELDDLAEASSRSRRALVGYRMELKAPDGSLVVDTSVVRAVRWVLA